MSHSLRAGRFVAGFLLVFAQAAYGIKFSQREFKFQVAAKASVSLDLRTVVKEIGSETMRFVPHNLPSWLTYDAGNLRLSGAAPTTVSGSNRFGVEVFQGSTSDFSWFQYDVFIAPKWKQAAIDLGTQWEGRPYSLDLKTHIDNGENRALSFVATGLPRWMSISSDGLLTGVPAKSDIGSYSGIVLRVNGPMGSTATAGASGKVTVMPALPKWTKDAIAIEDAVEDLLYERVLVEFVSNPDGLPLKFRLLPGKYPAWINITSQGKLFGVPRRKDVGPATVEVELSAAVAGQLTAEVVKFNFQVIRVNQPPKWKEDPILLPKGLQGNPYLADLSGFVDDPDLPLGDGLFLEVLSGPTWASIAPPALLRGTPPASSLGTQTWKIRVSDVAGLSATATVQMDIVKANKPPTLQSPLAFTIKERQTFKETLTKYANDPEGDTIRFEPVGFPGWAKLETDGRIELKPGHGDIGSHTLNLKLGDGTSQTNASVQITVQKDPHPPVWLEDPIRIDAVSGQAFALSIADKAQDLDGAPLKFSKTTGPAWLAIDEAGRVGGKPKDADVGEVTFGILARNDAGETPASLIVRVRQGNRPPQWKQDPVPMRPAKPEASYSYDLASMVSDPDNDVLRFTKINGPSWLRLTNDGKIGGTPSASDVGEYTAVFEVTDGTVSVQVGAVGRVGSGNSTPIIKGTLSFRVKEGATFNENLNQAKFVEDPDGDTLRFTGSSLPAWATLSTAGMLSLKPLKANVGTHSLRFEVTDGSSRTSGMIAVEVTLDSGGPEWLENPIQIGAVVNQAFADSLFDKVKDPGSGTIAFTKVSGPSWLTVTANGQISGTPGTANVGVNTFKVSAALAGVTSEATLAINVRQNLWVSRIPLDGGGTDPATEILWLIDNSGATSSYLPSLYAAAKDFYSTLASANIRHSSAVVSSRDWNGRLIPDTDGNLLLQGTGNDLALDFRARVERAYTGESYNSALWSLSRLYEVTATSSGGVPKGYWSDGTSMEVFMLSASGDSYKALAASTSKASYGVNEYVREFGKFHERSEQPFNFSVYDMRCPPVYDPSNPSDRPVYLQLAMATFGSYYYQSSACDDRVWGAIQGFQREVAFRAKVYSQRRFALSYPAAKKYLKVEIKRSTAMALPGNTGASDDAWYYDSKTKEIVVKWNKVKLSLQAGDELQITY